MPLRAIALGGAPLHVGGAQVELREAVVRRAEDERIARGPVTGREVRGPRALEVALQEQRVPDVHRELGGALVGGGGRPVVAQGRLEIPAPLGEPPERGVHRAGAGAACGAAASASASASDAAPCSTAWIRSASVPLQAVARAAVPAAHGTASSAASAAVTRVRSARDR